MSKKAYKEPSIEIYVGESTFQKKGLKSFFYAYFLCVIGLLGMFGTFFSSFPVEADWMIIFVVILVFLIPITLLFQRKKWKNLSYLVLLLFWIAGAFLLRNAFFPGFIQVINETFKQLNAYTQYNFSLLTSDSLFSSNMIFNNTVFLCLFFIFSAMLLSWLYNVANTRFGCFAFSLLVAGLPVAMELTPAYWALIFLALFWVMLLLSVPNENETGGFHQPKGQFTLLPLVMVLLIVLNMIFPSSKYIRSEGIENVREGFISGQLLPAPLRFGGAGSYTSGPNLAMAGNRLFTGKTVLKVKSEEPGYTEYLKNYVGNVYGDNRWLDWNEELLGPRVFDQNLGDYKVQNFVAESYARSNSEETPYSISIENIGTNPRLILSPYGLTDTPTDLSGINFVEDAYLKASNGLMGKSKYTLSTYPIYYPNDVSYDSIANNPENQDFVEAMNFYEENLEVYTVVPENLQEKMNTFRETYGLYNNGSPRVLAENVAKILDEICEYDLAPGVLPTGEEFVSYFLFQSQRGYCMHFASAAAMILRSAGVPTRYVEGYVVYPTDYGKDQWANIADSRAHAWVEIYEEGYGWIPIEVTPSIYQEGSSSEEEQEASGNETAEQNEEIVSEKPIAESEENAISEEPISSLLEEDTLSSEELTSSQPEPEKEKKPLPESIKRILSGILFLVIVVLIIYGRRKYEIIKREKALKDPNMNHRATYIYVYTMKLYKILEEKEENYPKELYESVMLARFGNRSITEDEVSGIENYLMEKLDQAQSNVSPLKKWFYQYIIVVF